MYVYEGNESDYGVILTFGERLHDLIPIWSPKLFIDTLISWIHDFNQFEMQSN